MPVEIRRIAVGVDFSEESMVALEQAMAIARHCGADIVMIHTGEVYGRADFELEGKVLAAAERYREILERRHQRARDAIEQLRERHLGQGVEIGQLLVSGFADEVLPEAARDAGAELLVVGTHGRTGIKRFLLGSVAERVTRLADCDVLIARAASTGPFKNVLVPSDFSPQSARALEAAAAIADRSAAITVLHCSDARDFQELPEHVASEIDAVIEARAARLTGPHEGAGQSIRFIHRRGAPAEQIRAIADRFDLICMGSHGRRGVRRMLLGSIAELTVRHAPCSVYVAHTSRSD